MTKRFLLPLVFTLVTAGLPGMQWPVADPVVSATFGPVSDVFLDGLELRGSGPDVRAVSSGRVIFSDVHENVDEPSYRLLVIEHEDGFRSLYSGHGFRPLDVGGKRVREGDMIGHLLEGSLRFRIYDTDQDHYVNPLNFLPELPDDQAPEIREVRLEGGGEGVTLEDGISVQAGDYEIVVKISDTGSDGKTDWAPYRLSMSYMGDRLHFLTFNTLAEEEGRHYVSDETAISLTSLLKYEGWLNLGRVRLIPGRAILGIGAEDFSGNGVDRQYVIEVR